MKQPYNINTNFLLVIACLLIVLSGILIINLKEVANENKIATSQKFPPTVCNGHTYESDDNTFYNGEILTPDYVHQDTLIVTNAELLNKLMQSPDIDSDQDIANILRRTTQPLNEDPREYQVEITEEGSYFYNGSRFVGFVPYKEGSTLDSIFIKDNL